MTFLHQRIERQSLPPPEPQPFVDILDIPPPLRLVPQGPTLFDLLKILPPLEDLLARRIAFSVTKPNFVPDIPPRWRRQDKPDPYAIFKRQIPLMVRACPEHHEWAQIRSGINLDNTEVQITERQWFWRTTCLNNTQSCFGFKQRDDGLRSECRQTNSWMIAWAKPASAMDYRWQHIAVPTGCACAVPVMSTF
ncbi:uncharacterized protein [Amphiura filiformis]|uniref:uncharacterized protein n=1 Tax=Amphiura filiformis TaxID=82378 RepID=UPI003B20FF5D